MKFTAPLPGVVVLTPASLTMSSSTTSCELWLDACVQGRNKVRLHLGKKQLWRPMFEHEVFRKEMYCIEEGTCDTVETFLCPPQWFGAPTGKWHPGKCAPLTTLVTPLHASKTSAKSSYLCFHPTCWYSSQWRPTVSRTPCHGAWTSAPVSANLSPGVNARNLKSRHPFLPATQ